MASKTSKKSTVIRHLSTNDDKPILREGDVIMAMHPRIHPKPAMATVLRPFAGGPKDSYVSIRFGKKGATCLTHNLNVRLLTDEEESKLAK